MLEILHLLIIQRCKDFGPHFGLDLQWLHGGRCGQKMWWFFGGKS